MTEQSREHPCAGRMRGARAGGPAKLLRTVDGRPFVIRRLRTDDRERFEAALAGLSERSRYLRFASPLPKLSRHLLDRLMDLDDHRHVAYAALTPDQESIVGAARYVRLEHDHRSAEVAIAVADAWQRVGVGPLLVNRLIAHARRQGVGSLIAVTLSENRAAKALAHDAGFSARGSAGLYCDYQLVLGTLSGGPADAERPAAGARRAGR